MHPSEIEEASLKSEEVRLLDLIDEINRHVTSSLNEAEKILGKEFHASSYFLGLSVGCLIQGGWTNVPYMLGKMKREINTAIEQIEDQKIEPIS